MMRESGRLRWEEEMRKGNGMVGYEVECEVGRRVRNVRFAPKEDWAGRLS